MVEADKSSQLMTQLRAEFRAQLPDKLASIEAAYETLCAQENPSFDAIRYLFHNLTGAGGTFGYPQITELARRIQQPLQRGEIPTAAEMRSSLEAMRQIVKADADHEISRPIALSERDVDEDRAIHFPIQDRVFYLAANENHQSAELMGQLEKFRLATVRCESPEALKKAIEKQTQPCVMVLFMEQEPITEALLNRLIPMRSASSQWIVILVSSQSDIRSRLIAGKAGIDLFLPAPVVLTDVLDAIERLRSHVSVQDTRVLIIDDEKSVARYHEAILTQAGMRVKLVHNIDGLDSVLSAFSPEIILMDLYMPQWSGPELAAALRQQMDMLDVPIVFLSSESNREYQLNALQQGGDDFLTKPIKPEFLIASVSIRARRYRELRRVMLNDGLTQVLNRRSVMQMLEREILRAQRHKAPLSVALLDVDFFKKINDQHGHVVGDFVLKTLTQMLKQRLRGTDIIGRYGGEEFLVLMPETKPENAKAVLDDIREAFSLILHVGAAEFSACFSGGIAAYAPGMDKLNLIDLADQGLYHAKNSGRNQLSIVNPE